jgi:hypothetical protein
MATINIPKEIGCYVDNHHGIYIGEQAISIAVNAGWTEYNVYADHDDDCSGECDDDGEHQKYYTEMQDKAEEWMNDNNDVPYTYWGSAPDTTDWGLWPNVDEIIDSIHTSVNGSEKKEWGITPDGYVIHINDHGNVTLYEIGKEIWSVV